MTTPASRMTKARRFLLVVGAGLAIAYSGAVTAMAYTVWAATLKLRGGAPNCPWARILTIYPDTTRFSDLVSESKSLAQVEEYDEEFGLQLISLNGRRFWMKREGEQRGAAILLGYLVAEHDWIASQSPQGRVRSGEIVIDGGAHAGAFTRKALALGAAKVVAIEPDPLHVECLRRNFREEAAAGQVVIVPKALWSDDGTMTLSLGTGNSGMSSLVKDRGGDQIEVPVVTLDQIVADLQIPRVDYIKLDIEGAEREALRGAAETLKKHRPRLMIDSYHREDDMTVLPRILAEFHEYRSLCGNCEPDWESGGRRLVPHYTVFE